MKWISVDDKLPEEGDLVLTRRQNRSYYSLHGYKVEYAGEWDDPQNITHWMPLPQPPKP